MKQFTIPLFAACCVSSVALAQTETPKAPQVLQLEGANAVELLEDAANAIQGKTLSPDAPAGDAPEPVEKPTDKKPSVKKPSDKKPKVLTLKGANAPDKSFTPVQAAALPMLARASRRAETWRDIKDGLAITFKRVDRTGAGISKQTEDKKALINNARDRARLLGRWLAYDLDGDGDVSMDELRVFANQPLVSNRVSIVPTPEQGETVLQNLMQEMNVPDLNNNDIFEYAELRTEADRKTVGKRTGNSAYNRMLNMMEIYHVFDTSGDGRITKDEYLAEMKQVFDSYDGNKDGKLERLEKDQLNTDVRLSARSAPKK